MIERKVIKRVKVKPRSEEDEALEEITFNEERNMLQDYRGRRVMAHPVSKLMLFKYDHKFNTDLDKEILKYAPAGANAYMLSKEREAVKNKDKLVQAIRFFQITQRIYDPRFSKTFADLEREEVDLGDAHLGYDEDEEIYFSKREVE